MIPSEEPPPTAASPTTRAERPPSSPQATGTVVAFRRAPRRPPSDPWAGLSSFDAPLVPVPSGDAPLARAVFPIRRLMAAMLSDALAVLRFPMRANLSFAEQRRVYDWITSDDQDFVFSFESVCDVLGVPPSQIRGEMAPHLDRIRRRVAAKDAKRALRLGYRRRADA